MKIDILCGHRTLRPFESEWIHDYLSRIGRYADISLIQIREKVRATAKATAEATWKEFEKKLDANQMSVMLEDSGEQKSTREFLELFQIARDRFKGRISFLIGGSYGFPPETRKKMHDTLSLSKLTLPHRIALLVLTEQIYRTLSLQAGVPYHRE